MGSEYDDVEIRRGGGIDMDSQGGDSVYVAAAMKAKKLGGIVNQRAIDDDNLDELQSNGNYNYYKDKENDDDNGSFRYDSSYQPRNKHL